MKRVFLLIALQQLLFCNGLAQDTEIRNQADKARTDLAVPDAPAFKLLDTDPSTILRPSSMREVGIALKDFALGGGVLPKAFAAEIAPYKLIKGGDISLRKYREDRIWYQGRVSIGTKSSMSGPADLAIGLRLPLIDDTDLRANEPLAAQMTEYTDEITKAVASYKRSAWYYDTGKSYFESLLGTDPMKDSLTKSMNAELNSFGTTTQAKVDSARREIEHNAFFSLGKRRYAEAQSDSALRSELDAKLVAPESPAGQVKQRADQEIMKTRETFKKQHWNGTIWEVGAAVLASSKDSLAKNLKDNKYGFWSAYAFPVWGNNGQMIIGLKGLAQRDTTLTLNQFEGSAAARLYAGTNEYKGFLEFDVTSRTTTHPAWTVSLGGELNFANGIWADFSVGYQKPVDGEAAVKSSFNVRLATPEIRF